MGFFIVHTLSLGKLDFGSGLRWRDGAPRRIVAGMTRFCLAPLALCATVAAAQTPVGRFDAETDVGQVRPPGSARYDSALQHYVISGAGQNMWNDRDDFHFVWKRMTGNFLLTTRAHFIGQGVEEHRKLGW